MKDKSAQGTGWERAGWRLVCNTAQLLTGTAGVSPASSNGFDQLGVEMINFGRVAFQVGGRDARGPSELLTIVGEAE